MIHVWWELTLMPGEGWSVWRVTKVANLWPVRVLVADRLVRREADQVLDDDSTAYLLEQAISPRPSAATSSECSP